MVLIPVARSFNEVDIEKGSEGVENDTNADEAGGVLDVHGTVAVDSENGKVDDENFDDDDNEIDGGGEAVVDGAAQDLVVDPSSPDGTREVAESKSHTVGKSSPDGAAVQNKKTNRRHRGKHLGKWQARAKSAEQKPPRGLSGAPP